MLIGRSRNNYLVAEVVDFNQEYISFHHGYGILAIQDSCSSVCAPHTAHGPIPAEAAVAGKDNHYKNRDFVGMKNWR